MNERNPPAWQRRVAARVLGPEGGQRAAHAYRAFQAKRRSALTPTGRMSRTELGRWKDRYAGQRCIIMGNGPSLKRIDFGLLAPERTFGLNRIYLLHDELGFQPDFHVVANKLVVDQCASDLRSMEGPLFTTWPNLPKLRSREKTIFLQMLEGPHFATDVREGVWVGGTVTYVALQLAYFMGFADVILVGVDHRFSTQGPANKKVVATGPDHDHFDPAYFGSGFTWELPDLEKSEIAYQLAKQRFEQDGRRVVDATVDGALQVFPKASLEDALG